MQTLGVREPDDFDDAFAAMTREPPDAILMVSDALTNLNRNGLMSYGPDTEEIFARAFQVRPT